MSQSGAAHPPLLPLACCAGAIALFAAMSIDAEAVDSASTSVAQLSAALTYPHEPPALAPSAVVQMGVPAYRMDEGKVTVFFAASRAELRPAAEPALQELADSWQRRQRLLVTGFHDETGNPQQNVVLARQRALAVQKRLVELGVPASVIVIGKPSVADDTQDLAAARRVEVTRMK